MNVSFFEYLWVADMERIHSQMLAWIFSPDCIALDTKEKQILFNQLFGKNINIDVKKMIIETEYSWQLLDDNKKTRISLDIIFKDDKRVIVIENKFKSSEHSNQLENYKKFIKKEFPELTWSYFFLTLIDSPSESKEWRNISYMDLYQGLSQFKSNPTNKDWVILSEYSIYLEKLQNTLTDVKDSPSDYDFIFTDWSKKKQDKKVDDYEDKWKYWLFIAKNQLETILQKMWLTWIAKKVKDWKYYISETHGTGIVDFIIQEDIQYRWKPYFSTLQLQWKTLKFTIMRDWEKNKDNINKNNMNRFIKIMENFTDRRWYKAKANKPIRNEYASLSKTMINPYWKMKDNEIVNFLKEEITNAKRLTKELIQKLQ